MNLVQQSIAGYQEIDVASADVTLVMSDGQISNARNMTLKFTGTLAGNRVVNFPTTIEKLFNIIDGTDHAGYTLTFKVTSQTGFLLCEGHSYICHADGTDIVKDLEFKKWRAISSRRNSSTRSSNFSRYFRWYLNYYSSSIPSIRR
jgi:hypothetical protein